MMQLVPFKVKCLSTDRTEYTRSKFGSWVNLYEELKDREYMVVGVTSTPVSLFLLAKPGELTHFYPKELCEVVSI